MQSKEREKYPKLSELQLRKLKQLSIIEEAHERCFISYKVLFQKLGINSSRELEDLIIELLYLEALSGKLDQQRAFLEIDAAIGRDVRLEQISDMSKMINMWVTKVETVLLHTANEIKLANDRKLDSDSHQKRIIEEVASLKAALRATSEADAARMEIEDNLMHPDLLPDASRVGVGHRSLHVDSPGGDRDGQSRMGVFRGLRRGHR